MCFVPCFCKSNPQWTLLSRLSHRICVRRRLYKCCTQFVSLHNLQNVLHDLARVKIRVSLRLGSGQHQVRVSIGIRVVVSVKVRVMVMFWVNNLQITCRISKLCSTFCKLCRLTTRKPTKRAVVTTEQSSN